MTVAYGAVSTKEFGTPGPSGVRIQSHDPGAGVTPDWVLVFCTANTNGFRSQPNNNDVPFSVSYGDIFLSQMPIYAVDTTGEVAMVKVFWCAGGAWASGAQDVVARGNVSANPQLGWHCISGSGNPALLNLYVEGAVIQSEDSTLAEQSVSDGSPGTNSVRFAFIFSGDATGPATGTNSTLLAQSAATAGASSFTSFRETTAGQGSRLVGGTLGVTEDVAAIYVAVREKKTIELVGYGTAIDISGGDAVFTLSDAFKWPAALREGDLIIAASSVSTQAGTGGDLDMVMLSSGYTEVADLYSSDTVGTNLGVFYKYMTATPDTTLQVEGFGNAASGVSLSFMAFRNVPSVADGGPFDTTTATATAIDTAVPNPPSLNHSGAPGIWTVIAAGSAHNAGSVAWYSAFPTGYSSDAKWCSNSANDTNDATSGIGLNFAPTDPEDPGVISFGNDSTNYSWAAVTMALKAPLTTQDLNGSTFTSLPVFPTGTVVGPQALTGTTFVSTPVFPIGFFDNWNPTYYREPFTWVDTTVYTYQQLTDQLVTNIEELPHVLAMQLEDQNENDADVNTWAVSETMSFPVGINETWQFTTYYRFASLGNYYVAYAIPAGSSGSGQLTQTFGGTAWLADSGDSPDAGLHQIWYYNNDTTDISGGELVVGSAVITTGVNAGRISAAWGGLDALDHILKPGSVMIGMRIR